jgi:hypothetical protein
VLAAVVVVDVAARVITIVACFNFAVIVGPAMSLWDHT